MPYKPDKREDWEHDLDHHDSIEHPERRVPPGKISVTSMMQPRRSAHGTGAPSAPGKTSFSSQPATAEASGGEPLLEPVRRRFESQLSTDLGDVRVHTGGQSQAAAASIAARAYTIGRDIHFGAGEYDPDSQAGLHLLAHEVAHTVQQGRTPVTRQAKREVSQPGDALEREADEVADALVAGRAASVSRSVRGAHAIMRWATQPPEAVAGRRRVQAAIQAARSPEEINAILAALEAPRESAGIVMIDLPGESEPVPVVDLDIADLIDQAHLHDEGESRAQDPTEEAPTPVVDRAELEAMSNEELEAELARVDAELTTVEQLSPEWSYLTDRRRIILDILMLERRQYPPLPEGEADRRARRERRERERLQNSVPLLEMEVDGDGEASATANPAEFANYIDRRVTAVGFGAYLRGYALYIEGSDQPLFVTEDHVQRSGGPETAASMTVHDSFAEAEAAAGPGQYAYYRGAGGVIAPTVFCEQTTPRVMWGIQSVLRLLSEHVVGELVGVVQDIITGRLAELGSAVLARLRARGARGRADGAGTRRGGSDGDGGGRSRTDGPDTNGREGPPPSDGPDGRSRTEGPDTNGRDGPPSDGPDGPDGRSRTEGGDSNGGDGRSSSGPDGSRDGNDGTRYAEPDDYELDGGADLARRRAQWARRPIRVRASGANARAAHHRAIDEVPNYQSDGELGYACALDLDSGRTAAVATASAPSGVPGGSQSLASAARARGIPISARNGGHADALRLAGVDDVPLSEANSGAVAFTAIERAGSIEVRLVSGQVNTPIYGRDRPPAAVLHEIQRAAQSLFPGLQVIMSAVGRGQ